ncbi:MAG: hypothetical protein LBR87_09540 [Synergistaceae bacterium]|nr:hypothetical protein [Synergistaceae bacterium]
MIWDSLWESAYICRGMPGSMRTLKNCFFSLALNSITFATFETMSSKSNAEGESSNLLASILDMSRMSFMTPSRWLDASFILPRL